MFLHFVHAPAPDSAEYAHVWQFVLHLHGAPVSRRVRPTHSDTCTVVVGVVVGVVMGVLVYEEVMVEVPVEVIELVTVVVAVVVIDVVAVIVGEVVGLEV